MRVRSFAFAALACTLIVRPSPASAIHPDFTGTWVLDGTKTEVDGQVATFAIGTFRIVQHGDTITTDREVADQAGDPPIKSHIVWGLDGKSWTNVVPVNQLPTTLSTVSSWDGDVLVTRSKFTTHDIEVEQLERWTLSADGKTIAVRRVVSAMGQDVGTISMTFVKK